MDYHKVTMSDCYDVASESDKARLDNITDFALLRKLALRWCKRHGYKLGGYLGNWRWDATK